MMEWTGQQQIAFLLQTIVLGGAQGLFLDVITGLTSPFKKRRWLWTDVIFGPVAAVITFFGALVVMDGQLHPLLLFGVAFGMVAQHLLIGTWVCRSLRSGRRIIRNAVRTGYGFLQHIWVGLANRSRSMCSHNAKWQKKGEK